MNIDDALTLIFTIAALTMPIYWLILLLAGLPYHIRQWRNDFIIRKHNKKVGK